MVEKNVNLVNLEGVTLYPQTIGSLVKNNSGETLATVEAGAQVNKIETIKVNGVPLSIANKTVEITIEDVAQDQYTIVKQATASEGFASTYYLTKNGTQVGDYINIPKDQVLQDVEKKTCTVANNPVEGYKVGDTYFEFTFQNVDKKIYLNAQEFVNTYTGGSGINISNTNVVSVDSSVVALKTDLSSKQNTLSTEQLNAVNSGITSAKVNTYDGYSALINAKADKATTLAGYGITDAVTKAEFNTIKGITYVEIQ